jgi:23S rRNA pseudouridine1911/1915/1917 synthase
MEKSGQSFSFTVLPHEKGLRLDLFLVHHLSEFSRSALLKLIRDGFVQVNGLTLKAGYRVRTGMRIELVVPAPLPSSITPEQVDFAIVYEDDSLLVLVKPPGLVVHPAAGHNQGTLAHGLLFHCKSLPGIEEQRPGLVHRLDKDTSGIMLVAKTDKAMRKLTEDFRNRTIKKTYHAILLRCPSNPAGRIVSPIGRHPVNRKKMAVLQRGGKYAATTWQIIERFECGICFVEVGLETGRTHQIRVHMASMTCPVAGDVLYGGKVPESYGLSVSRQLLHASTISFNHPETLKPLSFTVPLWPDIQEVLDTLRSVKPDQEEM